MSTSLIDHRLSVAPMLHWTDRWFRYCIRILTARTLLYTEMITTGALLHGNPRRFLEFDPVEMPLAIQLGGSDPNALAKCAKMAESWGYSEINLNVGCPSPRAQAGRFGACLMKEPELVAECVAAMHGAVAIPITVKHRIGIDHQDGYEELAQFIDLVAQAGCTTFIVHARKAWLAGLSPKENRLVPSINYPMVYAIKRDFPTIKIILNGGISNLEAASQQLSLVDGVMIGRAAYETPWILAQADHLIFGEPETYLTRGELIDRLMPWVSSEVSNGVPVSCITRHLLGLFHGQPSGRLWRRYLSEHAHLPGTGAQILQDALRQLSL